MGSVFCRGWSDSEDCTHDVLDHGISRWDDNGHDTLFPDLEYATWKIEINNVLRLSSENVESNFRGGVLMSVEKLPFYRCGKQHAVSRKQLAVEALEDPSVSCIEASLWFLSHREECCQGISRQRFYLLDVKARQDLDRRQDQYKRFCTRLRMQYFRWYVSF